jgi:uncharacterized protein
MKERNLSENIERDLKRKIVLLSGPRQSGKTTLARTITERHDYLNFDLAEHRLAINEKSWDRSKELIVFDELHKMDNWKSWLKGVYDVEGIPPQIIVTGSARLDTVKKVGDSMAGRYFQYRLHPFDIKETRSFLPPEESLDRLLRVGGFPEPFLENSDPYYRRWRKTHLDIVLRQDLIDLESVTDIKSIETLIELLRRNVGSLISHASLARDLQKDAKTIKRWMTLLENMYIIFPVYPWSRNIARAILKMPKYYFFDTGQVIGEIGVRLENVVAGALIKELHRLEDTTGESTALRYIRNKEGKEIDFAVEIDGQLTHLIEVKTSDTNLSAQFKAFDTIKNAKRIQLVKTIKREKTYLEGEEIREVSNYLANLHLTG